MNSLNRHLDVNDDDRDQAWDEKFFKLLSESSLRILSEDPQQGPDGWPYLITETAETAANGDSRTDSAQKILHWLSTRGIGLVVNPHKLPYPDFVFSFGMIWSFRETGYFIQYKNAPTEKNIVLDENSFIKSGVPTEQYLPTYVRTIINHFLRDQGVLNPKVLMISTDGENYDLAFSLESLGSPPETEHDGILEAISWFLPPHYSLAIISENSLPGFSNL